MAVVGVSERIDLAVLTVRSTAVVEKRGFKVVRRTAAVPELE